MLPQRLPRVVGAMWTLAEWALVLDMVDYDIDDDCEHKLKRSRTVPSCPDYSASAWAVMLKNPTLRNPKSRAARLFRRHFRLPCRCCL